MLSMDEYIKSFPKDLIHASDIVWNTNIEGAKINCIVVCGMGGSGIGAELIKTLFFGEIKHPVIINQGYTLPSFVNNETLLILSSLSGNTEEILSCAKSINGRTKNVIAISSGGKLLKFAEDNNFNILKIPFNKPPRTSLGFSIVALNHALESYSAITSKDAFSYNKVCQFILDNQQNIQQEAKNLASQIWNKKIFILNEFKDLGLGLRLKHQLNENSKVLCYQSTIPEMNHNELVALNDINDDYVFLFLNSSNWETQNKKRRDFIKKYLNHKDTPFFCMGKKDATRYEIVFYLIHFIDWLTFYLAEERGADPVEINILEKLKKEITL